MKIDQSILYSPCPCGSGKKFKFCCYEGMRDELCDGMDMEEIAVCIEERYMPFSDDPGVDRIQDLAALNLALKGRQAMMNSKFPEAASIFHDVRCMCPNMISAWDSEATSLWAIGEYEKAVEVAWASLDCPEGGSDFGLAQLAEFEYFLGNDAAYKRYVDAVLAKGRPRSVNSARKVCDALAHSHRHKEIFDYALRYGAAREPLLAFYASVAAANLKRWDDARRFVEIAIDGGEDGDIAYDLEEALEEEDEPISRYPFGEWPYFDLNDYPAHDFMGFAVDKRGPEHCNVVCDVAEIMLGEDRICKADALEAIAAYDGGRASKLRKFLSKSHDFDEIGEDERQRHRTSGDMIAMQKALIEFGYGPVALDEDAISCEPIPDERDCSLFWDATRDFMSLKISPGTKRWAEIRETFARLHAKYPNHAQCWLNYAGIFEREGKSDAAASMAEALFKAHPDYIFAAAAVAMFASNDGDMRKAADVIKSFKVPTRLHPEAYRKWLEAKRVYYSQVDDYANAKNMQDMIDRLNSIYHLPKMI